jgi:hypothetical protein
MTGQPRTMTDLFERIRKSREALEEAIAAVPAGSYFATGSNGWTVRDQLLHLAAWESSLLGILRGEPRGPAMGLDPILFAGDWGVNVVNAALIEKHAGLSLEAVQDWFARAHDETMAHLEGFTVADLQRSFAEFQPFPGATDAPIIGWIEGDTYGHFAEHLPLIREAARP